MSDLTPVLTWLMGGPIERASACALIAFVLTQMIKQAPAFSNADWKPQMLSIAISCALNLLIELRQPLPDWPFAIVLGIGAGTFAIGGHQLSKPLLARIGEWLKAPAR